jgi:hypothetical protein
MRNGIGGGRKANKISSRGKMSNESFITLSMLGVLVVLMGLASLFVPNFYLAQNIINSSHEFLVCDCPGHRCDISPCDW